MKLRKILRVLLPSLVVMLAWGCSDSSAPAAGGAGTASGEKSKAGADKAIQSRKGVEQSLGTKEIEEDKLPGTLEIGLAIGSTVAMIACFKYL